MALMRIYLIKFIVFLVIKNREVDAKICGLYMDYALKKQSQTTECQSFAKVLCGAAGNRTLVQTYSP